MLHLPSAQIWSRVRPLPHTPAIKAHFLQQSSYSCCSQCLLTWTWKNKMFAPLHSLNYDSYLLICMFLALEPWFLCESGADILVFQSELEQQCVAFKPADVIQSSLHSVQCTSPQAHIHRHWYWLIKVRSTSCISYKQVGILGYGTCNVSHIHLRAVDMHDVIEYITS